MIRWFVILAGVALGAGLALLFEASMGHLRLLAGDRLPGWTAAVEAQARLVSGRAEIGRAGPDDAPLHLSWSFSGIGAGGPHWRLRLDGPGSRGQAELHLGPAGVRLSRANLEIVPAALLAGPLRPEGIVTVAAEARFGPGRAPLRQLSGNALWRGAALDGVALGQAEIRLGLEAGRWHAPFTLSGGAVRATGSLEADPGGGPGLSGMVLSAHIEDSADIPEHWRRALDRLGQREDAGWQVEWPFAFGDLAAGAGQPPAAR